MPITRKWESRRAHCTKGYAQSILPVTQLAMSACNAPLIMWGQGRRHATRGVFVIQEACMSRKPWDLAFTAVPEEVAALRRIVRLHLGIWGSGVCMT